MEEGKFKDKRGLIKEFQIRLPELASKNMGCTVTFKIQIKNKYFQYKYVSQVVWDNNKK